MTIKQIQKLQKKLSQMTTELELAILDPSPKSDVVANGLLQARNASSQLMRILSNDLGLREKDEA